MDPNELKIPSVCITQNMQTLRKNTLGSLLTISRKFMTKFIEDLKGIPVLVVITDHDGYILEMYGDEMIKGQINSLGLSIGVRLIEEEVGTNGIALALNIKKPVQLIGDDHFHTHLHESACFSVPFQYGGQMGGTISMMIAASNASSFQLGLLSTAVDSIEREVQMQLQNEKLLMLNQVLIENSKNGIVITNESGQIVEINPLAEQILGCQKHEMKGRSIHENEMVGCYMEQVLSGNRRFEDIEISQAEQILLFDAFPIFDEDQQLIGAFGQFRDITDRLLLEKKVLENEKMSAVGKISAGLAHEIRNPLTSIMGLLKLVERNLHSTHQDQQPYFRIMNTELERINHLVNQFVLLAKPEREGLKKAAVNINELVEDIVTLFRNQLSDKKITIDFSTSFKREIQLDGDKTKQVLLNIIQNSIDAIFYEGHITISIEADLQNNGLEIVIGDNGLGMDSETVEKLFTPFYSTKENGLGLGMALSSAIVQLHKGRIDVSSEKGRGTTFTVWLPL
jgi:PAS domain S-box-containing protein